ncbi:MAG: hypothetical protein U0X91_30320 [Spirosomataceae bacterium]
MKKNLWLSFFLLLLTKISHAQPVIETEGGSSGIDVMSVVIGLVIGLVVGYLIGARMGKKG